MSIKQIVLVLGKMDSEYYTRPEIDILLREDLSDIEGFVVSDDEVGVTEG